MTGWRLREFHSDDLDGILHLWEEMKSSSVEPVFGLGEMIASCEQGFAIVAVHGDDVIGAVIARAAHDQAWVVFFAITAAWRQRGIGSAMLAAIEKKMTRHGLAKLSALIPEAENRVAAFKSQGFEVKQQLRYFERRMPVQPTELNSLAELGGRLLPRDLWESVAGMHHEKQILEQRLVMPLAQPELAEQFGVVPPRAVVLFGPPGTGKTTFAKAIASRLEWSFVEVFPSRLAAEARGLASALRETFLKISELEHAVVFIDEVEEIAAQRSGEPPSPVQGVTNELLKIIPAFREQPDRLLVCATNFIRALDNAFLRHGRFDYVIPIGLPDDEARFAIWRRYVPEVVADAVHLPLLVERTAGFSPADIEFAARSASQRAFEAALDGGLDAVADRPGPTTENYLEAIGSTRATVSMEATTAFLEDIEELARI